MSGLHEDTQARIVYCHTSLPLLSIFDTAEGYHPLSCVNTISRTELQLINR